MTTESIRKDIAELLCDFFRCPTTGRVLDGPKGDDKVLCGCGKTNPRVASVGHREAPGVHIKAYLQTATVDEWIAQEEIARSSWRTLVRIESVQATSADVVVPAWNSSKLVTVLLDSVPSGLRARFASGFRCHAHVNIGAEEAGELNFTDWEA